MARVFQIIPTTAVFSWNDSSVERDDRVMYAIGEDAEQALDVILQPYDGIGGLYLDQIQGKPPGPWAFVALRREYDIAEYVFAQRNKMEAKDRFTFTRYDARKIAVPSVGCFQFFSKNSLSAAAERIRFLQPAWGSLRDKPAEQNWLALLDEDLSEVVLESASGGAFARIVVCPQPYTWYKLHERLEEAAKVNPSIPPPPKPLVLTAWVYSDDVTKRDQWQKTLAWADQHG